MVIIIHFSLSPSKIQYSLLRSQILLLDSYGCYISFCFGEWNANYFEQTILLYFQLFFINYATNTNSCFSKEGIYFWVQVYIPVMLRRVYNIPTVVSCFEKSFPIQKLFHQTCNYKRKIYLKNFFFSPTTHYPFLQDFNHPHGNKFCPSLSMGMNYWE